MFKLFNERIQQKLFVILSVNQLKVGSHVAIAIANEETNAKIAAVSVFITDRKGW